MEDHLYYKENRIVISDELRKQHFFAKLYDRDKSQNKKVFYDFITYLYFVYWKKSSYKTFLPESRKTIVCRERLRCEKDQEQSIIDRYESDAYLDAINWYVESTKGAEEKLMDVVYRKIDEYMTFLSDFVVSTENHELYVKIIKGSNELLDLKDSVEQRVFKEQKKKGQGGTKASFIEQKNSRNNIGDGR